MIYEIQITYVAMPFSACIEAERPKCARKDVAAQGYEKRLEA